MTIANKSPHLVVQQDGGPGSLAYVLTKDYGSIYVLEIYTRFLPRKYFENRTRFPLRKVSQFTSSSPFFSLLSPALLLPPILPSFYS